jgi:hypothetical protein
MKLSIKVPSNDSAVMQKKAAFESEGNDPSNDPDSKEVTREDDDDLLVPDEDDDFEENYGDLDEGSNGTETPVPNNEPEIL